MPLSSSYQPDEVLVVIEERAHDAALAAVVSQRLHYVAVYSSGEVVYSVFFRLRLFLFLSLSSGEDTLQTSIDNIEKRLKKSSLSHEGHVLVTSVRNEGQTASKKGGCTDCL